MKKLLFILLLATTIIFMSCTKTEILPEDIGGKIYVYEGDGFGGDFIISIYDDGTFSYSAGPLSSYIGLGTWMLDGNTVTITEHSGRTNVFAVRDGGLVFKKSGSDNFTYVKLDDGARFSVMSEIGE